MGFDVNESNYVSFYNGLDSSAINKQYKKYAVKTHPVLQFLVGIHFLGLDRDIINEGTLALTTGKSLGVKNVNSTRKVIVILKHATDEALVA